MAPTDVALAHRIYYANPASETGQATLIRVVNITTSTGTVTISGIDDNGAAAPGGTVQFELGPREAKQLLTTDLENGNASKGLTGALGDGAGKWQLTVTADMDIAVMNLIRTADGFLTNLSRVAPRRHPHPGSQMGRTNRGTPRRGSSAPGSLHRQWRCGRTGSQAWSNAGSPPQRSGPVTDPVGASRTRQGSRSALVAHH